MKILLVFVFLFQLCNSSVILQVRFSEGTSTLEEGTDGIIEVLGQNNAWGTVCNIGFGVLEAQTACYMLGFEPQKALVVQNSGLTPDNTASILVSLVNCSGKVDINNPATINLSKCSMRYNQAVDKCGPSSTKTHVYCRGAKLPTATVPPVVITPPTCDTASNTLRLVDKDGNSDKTTGGRVEFYVNGTWSTVCKLVFDINAARAICGSLCTNNATYYARPSVDYNQSPSTTPMSIYGMNCGNSASSLSDCTYLNNPKLKEDCENTNEPDVGVDCAPAVSTPSVLKPPLLRCDNPNMIVTFPYAENPDLTVDMVNITSLTDGTAPECSITVTKESNNDIRMVIPMATCGAKTTGDAKFLILTVTIFRMVKSDNNVFRNSPLTITASCRFPRDDIVKTGGLDSNVNTLPPIMENDTIPVTLSVYRDRAFTDRLAMPVTNVGIGTRLYAVVMAETMLPAWRLILLNCFTTPSSDRTQTPKYDLIINKCRQKPDVNIEALNNSAVSFNFKLFPLSNSGNPTSSVDNFLSVYLHCDTKTCDPTVDGYRDCSNACNTAGKRKKRSVVFSSNFENVDAGPLLFKSSELEDYYKKISAPFGSGTSVVRVTVPIVLISFILSVLLC